jgi:uncharacterized protein YaiI (UPF0178 family)
MHIWVDADACPKVIKEILFRASSRKNIPVTLVANHYLKTPPSKLIRCIQVEHGFDVADNFIAQQLTKGDIVITADIPFAADVINKEGITINPRGELYTKDNIRQRLDMRNMMEELRGGGIQTGGPDAFSQKDQQAFANQLDRLLAKR